MLKVGFVAAALVLAGALAAFGDGGAGPAQPPQPAAKPVPDWAKVSPAQIAEATRLKVPVAFEDEKTTLRFVLIPGGTFTMGSPAEEAGREEDEGPQHEVTLAPYYLSVTEVSNAQFERFANETGHQTTAEKEGKGYAPNPEKGTWEETAGVSWRKPLFGGTQQPDWAKHPVVLVSWDDAEAYRTWAVAGLPTEAQFERALRGDMTSETYPWGSADTPPARFGNYVGQEFKRAFPKTSFTLIEDYDDGFALTAPVGSFAANVFGLHDISGNVLEWCADDYHGTYTGAPSDGSAWIDSPRGGLRVGRGGGFSGSALVLRSANRNGYGPSYRLGLVGFRVARAVP